MTRSMSLTHGARNALLSASLFTLMVTRGAYAEIPPMRVHFIDVGQGSAALFEFPCGAVLVDTGGERNAEFDGRQALLAYLDGFFESRPDLDRTLSLLAITHPHRDHTQGLRAVLESYTVENALVNGRRRGSGWYWEESEVSGEAELRQGQSLLLEQMPADHLRVVSYRRLDEVDALWDEVIDPVDCRSEDGEGIDPQIQVLWGKIDEDPGWGYEVWNGAREYHFANENNHSLVIRVDYDQASVLLTGDLEYAELPDGTPTAGIPGLLTRYGTEPGGPLDVDVYLVGHHGSHNGTWEDFLAAMTPQAAVISMGPYDRRGPWHRRFPYTAYQYGHPRNSIVGELQAHVGLSRRVAVPQQSASGVKKFKPMTITQCILATGWEGTVVLTAEADGRVDLARAAGGGSLCADGPGDLEPFAEGVAALAALEAAQEPAVGAFEPAILAPRPLCEASAALSAPWDESLVLVADNERQEQLYAFELDDGELEPDAVWQMPAKQRPDDVEALARLGEEVVIVGSHSRNKACETDDERQRLRRLAVRQDGTLEATGFLDSAAAWKEAMADDGARCLPILFTDPAPDEAGEVCAALVAAEKGASSDRCEVLNIEGGLRHGGRASLARAASSARRRSRGAAAPRHRVRRAALRPGGAPGPRRVGYPRIGPGWRPPLRSRRPHPRRRRSLRPLRGRRGRGPRRRRACRQDPAPRPDHLVRGPLDPKRC